MALVLISFFAPDRTGLIAAVAGRLFELGANLGDASFAVLGSGAEMSAVSEIPDALSAEELRSHLLQLPELAGAKLDVTPFALDPAHGPAARVTHRITVTGGDRPGLIARLSEVFGNFDANIVTMNAEHVPGLQGGRRYIIRFAVAIPEGRANSCLATVANTAEELSQTVSFE
ncbi:MAG: amino acid-binding protein [Alphaproteobacteria bacterium]|nr:amino acid-binding protein [Alphaproteobacteria bacterium]